MKTIRASKQPIEGGRTLIEDAKAIFFNAKSALAEMRRLEAGFHIFWLLGPLILLIERSPADVWLTLIAFAFLVRCFVLKTWAWTNVIWVRFGFAFLIVCLVVSALSPMPVLAIGETLGWTRFPLFAAATTFWLARDRRLLSAMLASTTLGLLLMCAILSTELVVMGLNHGRLSWPYGDHVPGSYLAKAGLPSFVVIIALAVTAKRSTASAAGIFALLTILLSVFAGERINFLIRACAGTLTALVCKPKIKRLTLLLVIELLAVSLVFISRPEIGDRFVGNFLQELPINENSDYARQFSGGIEVWRSSPLTGIGVGNYRHLCGDLVTKTEYSRCKNHPHNYYIQLLAETGLVGLVSGVAFILSILLDCFMSRVRNPTNTFCAVAFIIPFALFWPISSTADFFGQWINIFVWTSVGLALGSRNLTHQT